MKFQHPKHDDKKIITKFLLFPKRIGYETRWLEKVSYIKRYHIYNGFMCHLEEWRDIKWIDK